MTKVYGDYTFSPGGGMTLIEYLLMKGRNLDPVMRNLFLWRVCLLTPRARFLLHRNN